MYSEFPSTVRVEWGINFCSVCVSECPRISFCKTCIDRRGLSVLESSGFRYGEYVRALDTSEKNVDNEIDGCYFGAF